MRGWILKVSNSKAYSTGKKNLLVRLMKRLVRCRN